MSMRRACSIYASARKIILFYQALPRGNVYCSWTYPKRVYWLYQWTDSEVFGLLLFMAFLIGLTYFKSILRLRDVVYELKRMLNFWIVPLGRKLNFWIVPLELYHTLYLHEDNVATAHEIHRTSTVDPDQLYFLEVVFILISIIINFFFSHWNFYHIIFYLLVSSSPL